MESSNPVDAVKLGVSAALAVAVLWLVCSLLVAVFPLGMMRAGGSMMHGDFSGYAWRMSFGGIVIGGLIWSVAAGLGAGLTAAIYQRMV